MLEAETLYSSNPKIRKEIVLLFSSLLFRKGVMPLARHCCITRQQKKHQLCVTSHSTEQMFSPFVQLTISALEKGCSLGKDISSLLPIEKCPAPECWCIVVMFGEREKKGRGIIFLHDLKPDSFIYPTIFMEDPLRADITLDNGEIWCKNIIRISSRNCLHTSVLVVNNTDLKIKNLLRG